MTKGLELYREALAALQLNILPDGGVHTVLAPQLVHPVDHLQRLCMQTPRLKWLPTSVQ